MLVLRCWKGRNQYTPSRGIQLVLWLDAPGPHPNTSGKYSEDQDKIWRKTTPKFTIAPENDGFQKVFQGVDVQENHVKLKSLGVSV